MQFKRWFGNSKVKNADGTPKVMYRGGAETINVFDRKKSHAVLTCRVDILIHSFPSCLCVQFSDRQLDRFLHQHRQSAQRFGA